MDELNQTSDVSIVTEITPKNQTDALIRKQHAERALKGNAQLQQWPDEVRGVPNTILRSGLFGAVGRGERRYLERVEIASLKGIRILYTGNRLDQADLDAWVGILHLARRVPLGEQIEFSEKGFLRLIGRGGDGGRSLGKSDRLWLRKVFARLSATNIEVECGIVSYSGSLVETYCRQVESGKYLMRLNKAMILLFGRESWTGVDWAVRHALLGHPLAQWLHAFYSTHAYPLAFKYETLHKLCGSNAGVIKGKQKEGGEAMTDAKMRKAIADWREHCLRPALAAVKSACDEAGQPFDWLIEPSGLVKVTRTPTDAQRKKASRKPRAKVPY